MVIKITLYLNEFDYQLLKTLKGDKTWSEFLISKLREWTRTIEEQVNDAKKCIENVSSLIDQMLLEIQKLTQVALKPITVPSKQPSKEEIELFEQIRIGKISIYEASKKAGMPPSTFGYRYRQWLSGKPVTRKYKPYRKRKKRVTIEKGKQS